jgi:selenocysteine lyase/cysteine desulfurase
MHSNDIADIMAENNVCIRSGQHCAHPFLDSMNLKHTSRISLYIYNTKEDIDKFFEVIDIMCK